MADEWTTVISKNQLKRQTKRQQKLQQKLLEEEEEEERKRAEAHYKLEQEQIANEERFEAYAKIPMPEGPYVDEKGLPLPLALAPAIKKNSSSPLLSEELGTTDPKQISLSDSTFSKELKTFLASYPVPIYHLSFDYYHDMGYDRKGRRCPISCVSRMYIWTFHNQLPVVHSYDAYEMRNIQYINTVSPLVTTWYEYMEEWWSMDAAFRMMELLEKK